MVVVIMTIGEKISRERRLNGLTQEGLAKKVGISRSALSHYEKDRREPDYETLDELADFFEVSTDFLLGRTDKQKETTNDELEKLLKDPQTNLMFNGWKEMSEEERKEAIRMINYIQFKKKEEKGD